jgi:predicted molibdopterin-dependent oxidoreductase YjgC
LTRPLVRVGGRLVETDWDTAMGRVVAESKRLLEKRGPSAIGFYTANAHLKVASPQVIAS